MKKIISLFVSMMMLMLPLIGDAATQRITPLFPTSRIIMILDKGLDTNVLSIDRYTEVTWINDSQSDVKIKFGKGTQCKEVSSEVFPGLGGRLDPDKCFAISNSISPKGTLRFRFKEFGDYYYEVKYADTNRAEYGELKVF